MNPDRVNYELKAGDEYYPNGLFTFHITKLNQFIDEHPEKIQVVEINVEEYHTHFCNQEMNPEYIKSADVTRPVILAEIAPDRLYHGYPSITKDYYSRGYNIIDGHHRLAKAKEQGIEELKAYLIPMEQHIDFMFKGFETYVEYWNSNF